MIHNNNKNTRDKGFIWKNMVKKWADYLIEVLLIYFSFIFLALSEPKLDSVIQLY